MAGVRRENDAEGTVSPSRFADRVANRWPTLGWSTLAVFGLLLAFAAGTNPTQAPLTGSGPARLILGLPTWLKMTILGACAIAALGSLTFLFPFRRPRRRKEDEECQMVHEAPKLSPWGLVVLVGIALTPIALAGSLLWWGWPELEPAWKPLPPPIAENRSIAQPAHPTPSPPAVKQPLFTGAVAVLSLAVAVACVGMVLWLLLGDRIIGGWVPPTPKKRIPPGLAEVVEESLDSLREDPDARRAIIRCYRRFESVLAGIGVSRAPWETPAEFMRKTLGQIPVPQAALRALTGLFELSRFSQKPVGPSERDLALRSLAEIKGSVEQEDADAPTT